MRLDAEEVVDELDVGLAVRRELFEGLALGDVRLPARQRDILDVDLGKAVEVGWRSVARRAATKQSDLPGNPSISTPSIR